MSIEAELASQIYRLEELHNHSRFGKRLTVPGK